MKRKLLSILALLCLSVSSAWADWNGGTYTATEDEEINSTINVNADATLTINAGVTITINGGIVVADGKTLTVTGGGTLNVNGSNGGKGNNGSSGKTGIAGGHGSWGYDGGVGGIAIGGNVILKGATINARGGNGGNGGNGGFGAKGADNASGDADAGGNGGWGGWGGNGGAAFTGTVTIYSGNINARGGNGGNGGKSGNGGDGGYCYYEGSEDAGTGEWIYEAGVDDHGGNGGNGGNGGAGGDGGAAFAGPVILYGGTMSGLGGIAGEGGEGIDGENSEGGAPGGSSFGSEGESGSPGMKGESGSTGKAYANDVTFEASEYTMVGGDYEGCTDPISNTQVLYVSITADDAVCILTTANLVGGAYWSTFYSNTGNFIAPVGTQVFAVNLDGTTLTMTEIEDRIVKSGEGVVLKKAGSGDATTTIIMAKTESAASGDFSANSLTGTMTSITNPGNAYVLNYKAATGVGFYKLKASGTIGANKAYLTYSGASAREFFAFDETTALREISNEELVISNDDYYTLDGRKLQGKPTTKGLYIVNGKKVVIK